MQVNDFIKSGGIIEDLYLNGIQTATCIPINPLNQDLADYDEINPDIPSAIIDPNMTHLELIKIIDPKRPTVYFTSFNKAKSYIENL